MINNIYVARKFDAQMNALKKRWKDAKRGDTQERIEKEMDELRYKWVRHCFKQSKKIGEWWLNHRDGYIEKKEALLPYWEQYLEEIDEYLISDNEKEALAEWEEVIYQETKNWRDGDKEDEDLFLDFNEDEIFFDEDDDEEYEEY